VAIFLLERIMQQLRFSIWRFGRVSLIFVMISSSLEDYITLSNSEERVQYNRFLVRVCGFFPRMKDLVFIPSDRTLRQRSGNSWLRILGGPTISWKKALSVACASKSEITPTGRRNVRFVSIIVAIFFENPWLFFEAFFTSCIAIS